MRIHENFGNYFHIRYDNITHSHECMHAYHTRQHTHLHSKLTTVNTSSLCPSSPPKIPMQITLFMFHNRSEWSFDADNSRFGSVGWNVSWLIASLWPEITTSVYIHWISIYKKRCPDRFIISTAEHFEESFVS